MSGNTLSNQAGFTLDGNWKLPEANMVGTIENADDTTKGFGVENDGMDAGTKVDVDEILNDNDIGQQWERSEKDEDGYFTLKNPNACLYLSAFTSYKITIHPIFGGIFILFQIC